MLFRSTHSLVWSVQIESDNGGIHCAHIHPNLNLVAIGFSKPKWSVYDLTERKMVYMQIQKLPQASSWEFPSDN